MKVKSWKIERWIVEKNYNVVRRPKTEDGRPETEDRRPKTEDRRPKTGDGRRKFIFKTKSNSLSLGKACPVFRTGG
ncbi:MAG: hypothetical protein R6V74_07400 [Lutibacter sp.]